MSDSSGPGRQRPKNKAPQEILDGFWTKFHTKYPGKITSIFPRSLYSSLLPPLQPRGLSSARNAAESYEKAARECRERVKRIVRECERTNEKYTDPDFDIEDDLVSGGSDCLYGLLGGEPSSAPTGRDLKRALDTLSYAPSRGVPPLVPGMASHESGTFGLAALKSLLSPSSDDGDSESYRPGSVHRIDWIFESPQFTLDGFSSSDIEQGAVGDCWFMAAVANIAHRQDLMERVCVARDEECGVYGFVFYRDGEWTSTVVDDNLYLYSEDFEARGDVHDPMGKREKEYRQRWQTGSRALYFAKCNDPNETWLPLLEKAYAKAHGDFSAISGGDAGDGVEDLTGGVNTVLKTNRVLRKEKLWKELVESREPKSEFVFALGKGGGDDTGARNGLTTGHAYSVIDAREEVGQDGKPVRLVQIRNPWGRSSSRGIGEWKGPWSDGSKEWNSYWLEKLKYEFGDDGVFWMSYDGMLNHFDELYRTRLFDDRWTVVQQWTSGNISWVTGYLQTKFVIDLKKDGLVVIVLSQLDDRYFKGLRGQYWFDLHFVLQKEGCEPGDYVCRVRAGEQHRSVSCEVDLEAGKYEVLPKVTATRVEAWPLVEDVVEMSATNKPQKLRQIGMQYDLSHAKGGVTDEDSLLEKKRADVKAKLAEERKKYQEEEKKAMQDAAKHMEEAAKSLNKAATAGDKKEGEKSEKKDSDKKGEDSQKKATGDSKTTQQPTPEPDTKESSAEGAAAGPQHDSAATGGEDAPAEGSVQYEAGDNAPEGDGDGEQEQEQEQDQEQEQEQGGSDGGQSEAGAGDDSDDDDDDDDDGSPWNAVCVMGLRVYAQDEEVSITLVKPDTSTEASSLTVGDMPAGATM